MIVRIILLIAGTMAIAGIIFLIKYEKSMHDREFNKSNSYNNKFCIIHLFNTSNLLRKEKQKIKHNDLYDFNQYSMGIGEKILYIIGAAVTLFIIGYIFYRGIIGATLLTPLALLYPSYVRRSKIKLQKKKLTIEFKDALYTISSSLTVGKSFEVAIKDAIKELGLLYPHTNSYFIKELQYINRKIQMNVTVEEAFKDFAYRSHVEDIENFVEVLITCKRTGGNLVEVIRNTSKMISEKIEFQQELDLMLTKRKFEQKFLAIIPVLLVLALSWSAPDYMEPVFTTLIGRVVMTLSIGLFSLSMFLTMKIIKIEV